MVPAVCFKNGCLRDVLQRWVCLGVYMPWMFVCFEVGGQNVKIQEVIICLGVYISWMSATMDLFRGIHVLAVCNSGSV